jgi:hypothetical protein
MSVRTLLLLLGVLGAPPAAAARDLGVMPLSGQLTIDWTAIEPGPNGMFTGRYRLHGGIHDSEGNEMLLAGFDLRCVGTMQFGRGMLLSDEASCRATDSHGAGLRLDITGGADRWGWHTLTLILRDGTGPYVRVRGQGQVTRVMHDPYGSAAPWGVFSGAVRWRLD